MVFNLHLFEGGSVPESVGGGVLAGPLVLSDPNMHHFRFSHPHFITEAGKCNFIFSPSANV